MTTIKDRVEDATASDTAIRNNITQSKWRDADGVERIVSVPHLRQILDLSVMRQGEIMGIKQ